MDETLSFINVPVASRDPFLNTNKLRVTIYYLRHHHHLGKHTLPHLSFICVRSRETHVQVDCIEPAFTLRLHAYTDGITCLRSLRIQTTEASHSLSLLRTRPLPA